ncbi:MAG: transaldolase [Lewinellaceae bacterium]|nr:transaldolase [Lewinellaceae bacterium]MCB9287360.1 transaldolase [Lewinellaceae bacterium]
MNTLIKLLDYGQSYWLDNLTRRKITSGELKKRVTEQGLRGITSNPSIFNKAISKSEDYQSQVESLVKEGKAPHEIYEALTVKDVQDACDILRPAFDGSDGVDGFVSLEVSPYLARDAEGTIEEVRRLFQAVGRPNCFIKIPGTPEGLLAIERMLYEGVNINITLLFSVERYAAVARAYINALQRRAEEGKDISQVRSVASFFLSRIDVLTDQLLGHRIRPGNARENQPQPESLLGETGIASARLAYQRFKEIFSTDEWKQLAQKGAKVQRPLWASTSTKDPLYSDVRYVEALIGPDTVNTLPDGTIAAFADHGVLRENTVEKGLPHAREVFDNLARLDIDINFIALQLENEGIQKFIDPYDDLMATLAQERAKILQGHYSKQEISAGNLERMVSDACDSLDEKQAARRLFARDPMLWTSEGGSSEEAYNALGRLAQLLGTDTQKLLPGAARMLASCDPYVPARANPGLQLGAALGTFARHGRDKVSLVLSSSLKAFGPWVKQLLAESAINEGEVIFPVEAGPLNSPESYDDSRIFIHILHPEDDNEEANRKLKALEEAGHPVIRIRVPDKESLGGELFRWEIAAAIAEMVMGKPVFRQSVVVESRKIAATA